MPVAWGGTTCEGAGMSAMPLYRSHIAGESDYLTALFHCLPDLLGGWGGGGVDACHLKTVEEDGVDVFSIDSDVLLTFRLSSVRLIFFMGAEDILSYVLAEDWVQFLSGSYRFLVLVVNVRLQRAVRRI